MFFCFGGGQPTPTPSPPPPTRDDPESLRQQQLARQKAVDQTGQQATILTSGLGAPGFSQAGQKPGTTLGTTNGP